MKVERKDKRDVKDQKITEIFFKKLHVITRNKYSGHQFIHLLQVRFNLVLTY